MRRTILVIALVVLYLLHQDVWNWRRATPIAFGILPIGISYHVLYTLAVTGMMWLLVRYAWPSHLEDGDGKGGDAK